MSYKIKNYGLRSATVIVLRERGRTTVQIAELVGMKTEGVQRLFRRWKGLELNGDARRAAGRLIATLATSSRTSP